MNERVNFNEIYEDFFGKNSSLILNNNQKEEEHISINDYNNKIDSMYLSNESKELLKKIINYISNYKEDNIYVNFNIIIESKNKELIKDITNLINSVSISNKYIKGTGINNISLYKLEDINTLEASYNNYSTIVVNDLEGLSLHDINYNKKILYVIKEHLKEHKITIITGNKTEIDNLFLNNVEEKNNCINFIIEEELPNSNEILDNIIKNLPENIVNDKFKIDLLNYIEETFKNSGLDYPTYRDNLCRYITFNQELPKLEIVKTTEEIFKELNSLVGLTKVKKSLYDLVDLITLKSKTKGDLKLSNINLHMLFLGNPGTGKTTVARMLSNILYNLKFIRQNKLIEVSSKDLVAEYVGQTAPKTMKVVNKARGGILFIDEAYSLAVDKNNSYNAEAIATLIKAMEDYRDDLVVIFAGYTKEMQDFISSNSGIASRIGYTFVFEDYTNEELKKIFTNMMEKSGFVVVQSALDKLDNIISKERLKDNFGNARFIRNVYEKTIINHATNTKNIKDKNKLITITEDDIII